MRLWLHSYAPATSATPSVMLSVAAHAMLIGAAVYGTGKEAQELAEEISQRVYYLPPPDRIRASDAVVERIQYVDVGNGARIKSTERPDGIKGAKAATDGDGGRGAPGPDPLQQQAQQSLPSADSVYSILNVEETAVRSEWSAAPIYPAELIEQAVEGSVLANFVIDTTGRADTSTIEIVQSTHALFAQSVRTAIPEMRFSPASVQGRKVRQIVEQRFQFRITPPAAAPAEHTRTKPVP